MAPKKLSDADKQAILDLYRQPGETTSTLAKRYGVSNTTISRILKNSLADDEYEALIHQKRVAGKGGAEKVQEEPQPAAAPVTVAKPILAQQQEDGNSSWSKPIPKRRTRSHPAQPQAEPETATPAGMKDTQLLLLDSGFDAVAVEQAEIASELEQSLDSENLLEAEGAAFISDEDVDFEEDEDDDDIDDLDDDDIGDLDDDDEDDVDLNPIQVSARSAVQVLPLSEATLPKPCYLVVDRASELITRPLKEFGHLGQIPQEEVMERTLPVFDNHRVARRFSRKNQRVVKVPDGKMLEKTSEYLHAKGITRLLIDGQVYSVLN